jgi:hypothetical protein
MKVDRRRRRMMRRRRSGSERREERRSRQPGQALDVAATLLWTRQRTHAHMQQLHAFFGWSFRSVAMAMEVHATGFHFSLFRITIPLYTILDNSRCFSCFDHLASSAFACVLLEFIHQSIRFVSLSRL